MSGRERSAAAVLEALRDEADMPVSAMVEIADRCNEVCVHCYQEQGLKGEMSTDELKRLFEELAELGVLMLTLSGGEATLRRDFLELVAYARKLGFAVKLFTNGLTMTRELARALAEHAVHTVEISLYSQHAEVHDFVTGVAGSFERTVAGIRHLAEQGVRVLVKTPVMSLNEADIEGYAAFVHSLGAKVGLDDGVLKSRESGSREPERYARSLPQVEKLARVFREPPKAPPVRRLDRRLCTAAKSVHVEPNGELRPCAALQVDLGHALEEGVGSARQNNPRYAQLARLTWRDVVGCRECDLQPYCARCYAASLSEVGDALAPYPGACARARANYSLTHGQAPRVAALGEADADLGPYRRRDDGTFVAYRVAPEPQDERVAAELGWTRRPAESLEAQPQRALPGQLVQIRRPGRDRPTEQRIPSGDDRARRSSPEVTFNIHAHAGRSES